MILYHTSDRIIKDPDITLGRKNADFGAGFYMSADDRFGGSWARERAASDIYVNRYEADFTGLKVKTFDKSGDWFDYIFNNRRGARDSLAGFDVIIGPIANDTLFETFGIITSGLLKPEQALELLEIGPEYTQIAVKTEEGAARLRWLDAHVLDPDEIAAARAGYEKESSRFEAEFSEALEKIDL